MFGRTWRPTIADGNAAYVPSTSVGAQRVAKIEVAFKNQRGVMAR